MMGSLYSGATGMKTHGQGLNVVSNNIANVNTVGYKQKSVVFQDLISQNLAAGSAVGQGPNQVGTGVQLGSVRTIHTQGAVEQGNALTDFAISGKGFFPVSSGDDFRYTRAGSFRFDVSGYLKDNSGFSLMGMKLPSDNELTMQNLEPIRVDFRDPTIVKSPSKMSTALDTVVNLGDNTDKSQSEVNPYFGMLETWNGTATPPIATSSYTYSQPLRVYDEAGGSHDLTVYFDGAPSSSPGIQVFEYVIAMPPYEDGSAAAGTEAAGLLMSGTLQFSRTGELMDMTAFTPSGSATKDLSNWKPAPIVNGLPQFNANFAGTSGIQALTIDFGIKAKQDAWGNAPSSAAAIGNDSTKLPIMLPTERDSSHSTARKGSSSTKAYSQDGYPQGDLVGVEVSGDGVLQGRYSNNELIDFYQIPLARFTSEDGLRREGSNHYSTTLSSGAVEFGKPGESNLGSIITNQLETSNVDMSREMVNMIILQRGFQMNSKSVTVADSMLQKALELKRT